MDEAETVMTQLGIQRDADYNRYAEEYGEENAEYLMEMLGNWTKNYKKQTFIDTGVGDSAAYEAMSEADAKSRDLEHESIKGDIRLIQDLLDGNWNPNDFLVIPPGNEIAVTHDEAIVAYKPV